MVLWRNLGFMKKPWFYEKDKVFFYEETAVLWRSQVLFLWRNRGFMKKPSFFFMKKLWFYEEAKFFLWRNRGFMMKPSFFIMKKPWFYEEAWFSESFIDGKHFQMFRWLSGVILSLLAFWCALEFFFQIQISLNSHFKKWFWSFLEHIENIEHLLHTPHTRRT